MGDDDLGPEGGYGLIMPFVVTTDAGGPFDSAAYVAGWECGAIDAFLSAAGKWGVEVNRYVDSRIVPQLDLIAMRHGYTLSTEAWEGHEDEWTLATFAKAAAS
jgi:hypothetical protein